MMCLIRRMRFGVVVVVMVVGREGGGGGRKACLLLDEDAKELRGGAAEKRLAALQRGSRIERQGSGTRAGKRRKARGRRGR